MLEPFAANPPARPVRRSHDKTSRKGDKMRGRAIRWALPFVLVAAAAAAAAMLATAGGSASNKATVDVAKTSALGPVLVAANRHALYRYTIDGKGVNRCSAVPACSTYWPALTVKAGVKPTAGPGASTKLLGTIAAAHGMRQITYAGYPLYFFSGDKKAGQVNGQGFGRKWYLVAANGAFVKHAPKAASSHTPASTSATNWG
jgi:predicted lipoprotein with Yx(FWY)xxD motif